MVGHQREKGRGATEAAGAVDRGFRGRSQNHVGGVERGAARATDSRIDRAPRFWDVAVMTSLHKLLIVALLAVGAMLLAPAAQAQRLTIEIGDRPYYTRGASYWDGDVQYYWAPGHWGPRHRWVRGHYVRRTTPLRRLHREHRAVHRAIFGR